MIGFGRNRWMLHEAILRAQRAEGLQLVLKASAREARHTVVVGRAIFLLSEMQFS